jgi:catalase (peroxidase I)
MLPAGLKIGVISPIAGEATALAAASSFRDDDQLGGLRGGRMTHKEDRTP